MMTRRTARHVVTIVIFAPAVSSAVILLLVAWGYPLVGIVGGVCTMGGVLAVRRWVEGPMPRDSVAAIRTAAPVFGFAALLALVGGPPLSDRQSLAGYSVLFFWFVEILIYSFVAEATET